MSLLTWISDRLPIYSRNALLNADGEGYYQGYIDGCRSVGLTRDTRGRFQSLQKKQQLKPKRNYGKMFAADEDLSSLRMVESPDRRSSSLPD